MCVFGVNDLSSYRAGMALEPGDGHVSRSRLEPNSLGDLKFGAERGTWALFRSSQDRRSTGGRFTLIGEM